MTSAGERIPVAGRVGSGERLDRLPVSRWLTEGIGRLFSGVIGPSLIPPLLDAAGVGAVYLLVGAAALVAVVTVTVFGTETKGRRLESI